MLTLVGKVDHAKTASVFFYGDLKKLRISSDLAEVLLLQATKVGVMENINGQYFFPQSINRDNSEAYNKRLATVRKFFTASVSESIFGTVKCILFYSCCGLILSAIFLGFLDKQFNIVYPPLAVVTVIASVILPLIYGVVYRKEIRVSVLKEKLSEYETTTRCSTCNTGYALDAPSLRSDVLYTTQRERKSRRQDGKVSVTSWVEVTLQESSAQSCLVCGHVHHASWISRIENSFQTYIY
jgi:hypothetical protein